MGAVDSYFCNQENGVKRSESCRSLCMSKHLIYSADHFTWPPKVFFDRQTSRDERHVTLLSCLYKRSSLSNGEHSCLATGVTDSPGKCFPFSCPFSLQRYLLPFYPIQRLCKLRVYISYYRIGEGMM